MLDLGGGWGGVAQAVAAKHGVEVDVVDFDSVVESIEGDQETTYAIFLKAILATEAGISRCAACLPRPDQANNHNSGKMPISHKAFGLANVIAQPGVSTPPTQ